MQANGIFSKISFSDTNFSFEEKETLRYLESIIQKNTLDQSEKIEEKLINFPYLILLKFCSNSFSLSEYCHENPAFKALLIDKLKKHNYIEFSYETMNQKSTITPFHTYIAASYFYTYSEELPKARSSQEAKTICMQALDNACNLGLYDALIHRCKFHLKHIMTDRSHVLQNSKLLHIMKNDLDMLSNHFWSVGFFQAGCILENLSEIAKQGNEEVLAVQFKHEAVRSFLCALHLKEHAISRKILDAITQKQGLSYLFSQMNFKISTKEEAFTLFESWLDNDEFQLISNSVLSEMRKYISSL